jgi:hypothetical protein
MFHKVPFAKPADAYESAEWRLELLGGTLTGGGGGGKASGSGSETTGHTASFSFNASSRLINIRADQKPASLANMQLRFWQRAQKGEPKDARFKLQHEGKIAHKGDIDLKSLGLAGGISLKGFDADRPIEISLVPADYMSSGSGEPTIRVALSNSNWRLDLVLDKRDDSWYVSPQSRLTNIQPARRKLLVYSLRVSIGVSDRGEPQVIELQGEPIGWSSSRFLKELGVAQPVKIEAPLPDNLDFDHDIIVRQVATWDSNPVKRVDFIGVGMNSHMTNNMELTTYKDRKINETGKMEVKGSSASSSNADASDDDEPLIVPYWRIEHRRYLVSTNQVRILPCAIQVIVDQGQMEEVLAALEPMNSRLNFIKTAVNWKHVPAVLPEGVKGSGSIVRRPPPPLGSLPFNPKFSGGVDPTWQPSAAPDHADAAMVELTVYGMVKLFEPPSNKKAAPPKGSKP